MALHLFNELEKGILNTLKAADLFAINLVAIHRNKEPDLQLIRNIIAQDKISGLMIFSRAYTDKEKKEFVEKGHLVNIGNQVLLATYTALEFYLINKFREYLAYRMREVKNSGNRKILEEISFRSLDNLKELYKKYLGIHLPQFEITRVPNDELSIFKPESTWHGIKMLEEARHEIAHNGESKSYRIAILPDVWDVFNFVRYWVMLFDANFDRLVYTGRPTPIIIDYQKRVKALVIKKPHMHD